MSAQPRWSLIQRKQHVLRIQWNGVNGNGLDEAMTNRQEQGLSVVRAPQGWTDTPTGIVDTQIAAILQQMPPADAGLWRASGLLESFHCSGSGKVHQADLPVGVTLLQAQQLTQGKQLTGYGVWIPSRPQGLDAFADHPITL